MNKQDALTKLAALEAETAALRRIIEAPEPAKGLWRPQPGESFCYVNAYDGPLSTAHHSSFDKRLLASGNIFPSLAIAEKASPLMARANKIIAAALQADPEAGQWSGARCYSAGVDPISGGWRALKIGGHAVSSAPFVHTYQQAEAMASILNAEGVK